MTPVDVTSIGDFVDQVNPAEATLWCSTGQPVPILKPSCGPNDLSEVAVPAVLRELTNIGFDVRCSS